MKKIIFSIIAIVIALPMIGNAATNTKSNKIMPAREVKEIAREVRASSTRPELMRASSTKRDEVKEKIQEKIASTTARAFAKKSDKAVRNLTEAIQQLTDRASSTEARMAIFTKNGVDMSSSTIALADARAKIEIAKTKLAELVTYLDTQTTITTKNRGQVVKDANAKAKIVDQAINTAHKALVQVLAGVQKNVNEKLKSNRPERRDDRASTTASTTRQ
ncbi:MAG: hypothetical protein WCF94_03470 [bacterium]